MCQFLRICQVVFGLWLLVCSAKAGESSFAVITINNTTDSSQCNLSKINEIICPTLMDALNVIKSPEVVECVIQIMTEMPSEKNTEIILDGTEYASLVSLDFLWLSWESPITLANNTFFIKMSNIHFDTKFMNLVISGDNNSFSAIEFHSSYSNVTLTLNSCIFSNGNVSGPVTLFDLTGSLIIVGVQYSDITSSAACGSFIVRNYSTVSFFNLNSFRLSSQGNGGVGCIYGSEGSEFKSELGSFAGPFDAEYGGILYIEGPGKYILSGQIGQLSAGNSRGVKRGYAIYATGFDEFNVVDSTFASSIRTQTTMPTDEGGLFYLTSSREGSSVAILHSSMRYGSASEMGGLFYVQNVTLLNITSSEFTSGQADTGYGGCVVVDNVHSYVSYDTIYSGCAAKYGGAIACFNGSSIVDFHNVTFMSNIATSSYPSWNTCADSSCSSPFWTTIVDTVNCTVCNTTVCGENSSVKNAECFCEGPNCSNTTVNSPLQTSLSNSNSGMGTTTIVITVLSVVCVGLAIIVVGVIGYLVVTKRKQRFSQVALEIEDEHIQ